MRFNPKLIDFLKENKDIGIIAFAWSIYWRITLIVGGISFLLSLLFALFSD